MAIEVNRRYPELNAGDCSDRDVVRAAQYINGPHAVMGEPR
jgi:hypothetical protein